MTQVLVVDDSLSVRKALETILRPLQYTVRMAEHGEAALEALRAQGADLVIADVLMPGIGGFELCQQLRSGNQGPPVILISGIVSDDERERARQVGAYGLVKKPFRADDLLPVVRSALATNTTQVPVTSPAEPAPVTPGSAPSPAYLPVLGELLDTLLSKPNIMGAVVIGEAGQIVSRRGRALPQEEITSRYMHFFAATSAVMGQRLTDEWQTALLEYGGQALLLVPLARGHVLIASLKESSGAAVARFVIRNQREQFEQALASA